MSNPISFTSLIPSQHPASSPVSELAVFAEAEKPQKSSKRSYRRFTVDEDRKILLACFKDGRLKISKAALEPFLSEFDRDYKSLRNRFDYLNREYRNRPERITPADIEKYVMSRSEFTIHNPSTANIPSYRKLSSSMKDEKEPVK